MHVGLNLLYLLPGVVGGTETYAAGLLRAFAEVAPDMRFTVFVNERASAWPIPDTSCFERVVCPVDGAGRIDRYRWEQLRLPSLLRRRYRVDLLHSLGYVSPLRAPCPSVVTIHDLNYRAFGDRMPWSRRLMLRAFVERSARRAAHVLTDSAFSKGEITSQIGIPPERVTVTPLGAPPTAAAADGAELRAAIGLERPYVIAFSSPSPNKNIPRLLEAYALARRDHGLRHDLVLVGHPPAAELDGDVARPRDGVHVTGYVDAATLGAVLAGADLLAFPSLYEGFGLPVLEAMAAGVPVACSRAASLPEVGGDAAVYFDPRCERDIASAIAGLAGDPQRRAHLAAAGRAHAATFTWTRTAEQTLSVYRNVLAAGAGRARATR